jgi:D-glycero-beta-D-manno-heptose 1-phosphate adenylyltransferase
MVESIARKIYSLDELIKAISRWRLKSERVVFTNGVFDILHSGHVDYLARASKLGNRLIIGLNSDASVKRLGKGDDRPVNKEIARAQVISALASVDAVIIFDEDTPFQIIKALMPDVLVKGGDYNPLETDSNSAKYMVGSDIVRASAGEVQVIPFLEGYSSTSIINKIKGIG